jgi:hypothetical protein
MASTRMAKAVQSVAPRPGIYRVGTVSTITATTLDVVVGSTTITAAYLDSYAAAEGDLVVVGNQDASWIVLGKQAGVGPNLVQNGGFEADGEMPGVPSDWFLYDESGTASTQVLQVTDAPSGDFVLQINPDLSARTTVMYSQPWAVDPGQTYALSAFAGGVDDSTGDIELHLLCFASATDLMPTTTDNVTAASVNDVGIPSPYTSISGSAVVPVGTAAFARLGLRSVLASGVGMQFDFCIARRTG